MYGAEPCAARAFAPVLAGAPEAEAWPVAASAASVPPSSALTDTAMTRANRFLRDNGARPVVGNRMIVLNAPADRAGSGSGRDALPGGTASQRRFSEPVSVSKHPGRAAVNDHGRHERTFAHLYHRIWWYLMTRETAYPAATGGSPAAAEPAGIRYFYGVSGSRTTSAGWLARMGFADPARAERLLLTDLGVTAAELRTDPLVTAIAAAADPDLAVTGLSRLFGATASRDALGAALRAEEDFPDRLTAGRGVSTGRA